MVVQKPKAVPIQKEKLSILEQIKKIQAEQEKLEGTRAQLLDTAKAELLEQGQKIVGELKALGFAYSLALTKRTPQKQESDGRSGPRAQPHGICPLCQYETAPAHDRRSHRHQTVKGPFSPEELKARNMTKVG